MKIKKVHVKNTALSVFLSLALVGCGGGGGSSSSNTTTPNSTGFLKDSNLEGITYTCGTLSGTTDSDGKFEYNSQCETVEFSIGDLKLGSVNRLDIKNDNTVYPADLLGLSRANTTDTKLVTMLQVLQSLDDDNNPNNGIKIPDTVKTSLTGISEIDLSSDETTTDDINSIAITTSRTLINATHAVAHYEDTLNTDLDANINNVAPAPAIFDTNNPSLTNSDTTDIIVYGEVGAKIIVNGVDSGVVISDENKATLSLDTSGADEVKSFDIILRDDLDQDSDASTFNIEKDSTGPQFTVGSISIDENSTQNVIDINPIEENGVSYTLTGIDSSYFEISENGIITLKTPANYEEKQDYSFTVKASDSLGNETSEDVTLTVNHLNDETPVLNVTENISFNENMSPINFSPLSYTDNDIDENQTFTYSISGGDSAEFSIDSTTGEISFMSIPDYELKQSYSFNATVSDGINTSEEKTVLININPQNDIAPVVIAQENISIDENSLSNITTFTSSDADVNQNQNFTYAISGTDAELFNLNTNTGELSLKAAADYETKQSYSFNISVNDGVNTSEQKTITVNINHLNDEVPVINTLDNYSIDENSTAIIATIQSTDNDLDETQVFTYSLSGTDANYFNINQETGELTLKNTPDYEVKQSYSINVIVNDGVNTSEQKAITVNVNHLNDESPIVTNVDALTIDEGSNTQLTISSTDADIDENQTFTYTLGGTDMDLFNFDSSSGVLTFKNTPDYENPNDFDKNNVYDLTIQVSDGVNSSIVSDIQVNLNNIDDVPTPAEFNGTVTGTVNTGTAIANATVVLQDINQQIIDTITDNEGRYTLALGDSYQGPFIIKAFLPTGEILYSYNDGTKEVTNITPLTSLIISKFVVNLNTTMYGLFADFNTIYSNYSNFGTLFENAYNEVNSYFTSYLTTNLLTNFNHFYNRFYNLGFDYDRILDNLDMAVTSDVVIVRHDNNVLSTIPNITIENIDVTGRILDSSGSAIEGANIIAQYADSQLSASTDSNGRYTFNVPNYTNIDLNISYDSRIINYYGLSTFFSNSANAQQVETIQYSQDNTTSSTISGYIYNGRTTATKIPEVTIKVREGYNNKTGEAIQNITSDVNGDYSLDLVNGNYTFEFSKDQWTTEYYNILVNGDSNTQNYFINSFDTNYLAPNALMTAVLRWGDRPNDLDTHLQGPIENSSNKFHISWQDKIHGTYPSNRLSPCDTEGTIATLDVDDTTAYGPETLSLCERVSGKYHYYIYNYSGSPQFDVSNANVRVQTANGFNYTFTVPYEPTSNKRYWHVFDIDEYGNIVPINSLKSSTSEIIQ